MQASRLLPVLVGVLLCVATGACAETWDLAANWSSGANPSADGIWKYGFSIDRLHIGPGDIDNGRLFGKWVTAYIGWADQPGWVWPGWESMGLCKATGGHGFDEPAGRVIGFGWTGFGWVAPRNCTVSVYGGAWNCGYYGYPIGLCVAVNGAVKCNNVAVPLQSAGYNSSHVYTYYEAVLDGGGNPNDLKNISLNAGDTIVVAADVISTGPDLMGFDFTVTEDALANGAVSGTVTQKKSGAAISGASVSLTGAGGFSRSTTTLSDGSFAFTDVPASGYNLTASASGFQTKSITIGVNPGATETAGLALAKDVPETTWDLAANWSETANPSANGMWTYGYSYDLVHIGPLDVADRLFSKHTAQYIEGAYGFSNQPGWVWPGWESMGLCKIAGANAVDAPVGRVAGYGWDGFIWTAPEDGVYNVYGGVWKTHDSAPQGVVVGVKGTRYANNVVVPARSRGYTSSNVYTYYQALLDSGSDPAVLKNLALNEGDVICVLADQIPGNNVDLMGFDFTVTQNALANGTISGIVSDSGTSLPVSGASVTLTGKNGVNLSATTGADGSFSFADLAPFGYTISAGKDGYATTTETTGLNPGASVVKNLAIGVSTGPQTWDLAADFSELSNPTPDGVWTYGYSDDMQSISRVLFGGWTTDYQSGILGFTGQPAWHWLNPAMPTLGLCKSNGNNTCDFPAGKVGGYGWSGALWKATKSCKVNIYGGIWRMADGPYVPEIDLAVKGIMVSNAVVPKRTEGFNSASPYTFYQAVADSGRDALALQAVEMSPGDTVCIRTERVYPSYPDMLAFDLTITESALANGNLRGVIGTTASPVAGATVHLTGTNGVDLTVTSGSDGRFAFDDLAPFVYTVSVTKEGYDPATVRAGVNPGQTIERQIRLISSEVISVGELRSKEQGYGGKVKGIVTAKMTGHAPMPSAGQNIVAIEAEDRSAGVLVYPAPTSPEVEIGDEVIFSGYVEGTADLRQIACEKTGRTGIAIKPVGMSNKSTTHPNLGIGANNYGILATVWGRIVADAILFNDGEIRYHISDGTLDVPGEVHSWSTWMIPASAIEIVVPRELATDYMPPYPGQMIRVTGILYPGVPMEETKSIRAIYVRSLEEITVIEE